MVKRRPGNSRIKIELEELDKVKTFLKDEPTKLSKQTKWNHFRTVMPILHNPNYIILLFNGWSINLKSNRTWWWEDTTGG